MEKKQHLAFLQTKLEQYN